MFSILFPKLSSNSQFPPKVVEKLGAYKIPLIVVAALVLVWTVGCDSSAIKPMAPQRLMGISNLEPIDTDEITVAEARQFASDWQVAMENGDAEKVKQLVSWTTIVNQALAGLPFRVPSKDRDGFEQGSAAFLVSLVGAVGRELEADGDYQTLRVVNRGSRLHVIFRLVGGAGLNYHDLRLTKVNGAVIVDSIFFATTGESVSTSLRNTAAPAFASQSLLGKISGQAKQTIDEIKQQAEIVRAHTAGDNAKALRLFDALPEHLKKNRGCMLARIAAIDFETDEDTYLTAIEDFIDAFPDNPSMGIMLADVGILKKDASLIKKSRDQITKFCGGDAYFDLTAASGLCQIGDLEGGLELSKGVDPKSIGNDDAHDFKLSIALLVKDYDTVLKNLRILRDDYGYEFADLSQVENFKAFSQSPQHAQWLKD